MKSNAIFLSQEKDQRFELLFGQRQLIDMREVYRFDLRWTPDLRANMALDLDIDITAAQSLSTSDIPDYSEKLLESSFHTLLTQVNDHAKHSAALLRGLSSIEVWHRLENSNGEAIGLDYAAKNTISICLACDWLGQFIGNGARVEALASVAEKGLESIYRALEELQSEESYNDWRRSGQDSSSAPIPRAYIQESFLPIQASSALLVGAITFARQFGNNSRVTQWVDLGIKSIVDRAGLFYNDGSFPGSASQALYAGEYLALATDVLNRFEVIDIQDAINWTGLIRFLASHSYTKRRSQPRLIDFGDTETLVSSSLAYWVANRKSDGYSNFIGSKWLANHNRFGLAWFDKRTQDANPVQGPSLDEFDSGSIVYRDYGGPSELMVATRLGGPIHGEHGDLGSIVIGAYGELFISHPGSDSLMEGQSKTVLRRPENKNVLIINGRSQDFSDGFVGRGRSEAIATLIRSTESDAYSSWSADMSSSYGQDLSGLASAVRSVFISKKANCVVVVDKVSLSQGQASVESLFRIANSDSKSEIKTENGNIEVLRPEGRLQIQNIGLNGATLVKSLDDPFESSYPQYRSKSSKLNASQLVVTAFSFSKNDVEMDSSLILRNNGSIRYERKVDDVRVWIDIFDGEKVPDISHRIQI